MSDITISLPGIARGAKNLGDADWAECRVCGHTVIAGWRAAPWGWWATFLMHHHNVAGKLTKCSRKDARLYRLVTPHDGGA